MTPTPPFPFIVGSGRCGTTLVRVMLDAHPAIAIPNEAYFPIEPAPAWSDPSGAINLDAAVSGLEAQWWLPRWKLEPGAFRTAAIAETPDTYPDLIRCLYGVYASARDKARYGSKTPKHVLDIEVLARMLPEAVFIHLVRDGRDVALSYLDTNFGPKDLAQAAGLWRRRVERGRSAGRALGTGRYLELRYEDLLDDPELALRELCGLIGLTFDPAMLRYHEGATDHVSGTNVNKVHKHLSLPPTKGLRDWRAQMSGTDVALFESIAGPTLEAFGYERSSQGSSAATDARVRVRRGWSKARRRLRRRGRSVAAGIRGDSRG